MLEDKSSWKTILRTWLIKIFSSQKCEKKGILSKRTCFSEMYWLHEQFHAKPAILTHQEPVKATVQLCDLSDPCEKHGSGPQASALTPALWISPWRISILTHIRLQTSTCWSPVGLGEMAALESRCPGRIKGNGCSSVLSRALIPFQQPRGWRGDCGSVNSGWNAKCGEVTLISYPWLGAPGPKGEKGMAGATEEGVQGPRGRTGRVNTTSLYWPSGTIQGSPAAGFKASFSLRATVVGQADLPTAALLATSCCFLSAPGSSSPLVPIPR